MMEQNEQDSTLNLPYTDVQHSCTMRVTPRNATRGYTTRDAPARLHVLLQRALALSAFPSFSSAVTLQVSVP